MPSITKFHIKTASGLYREMTHCSVASLVSSSAKRIVAAKDSSATYVLSEMPIDPYTTTENNNKLWELVTAIADGEDVSNFDTSRMTTFRFNYNTTTPTTEPKPAPITKTYRGHEIVVTSVYEQSQHGGNVWVQRGDSLGGVLQHIASKTLDPLSSRAVGQHITYKLNWNTRNITSFESAFVNMNWKPQISHWDTSNAVTMLYMLSHNSRFDDDLSKWSTKSVSLHSNININSSLPGSKIPRWQYDAQEQASAKILIDLLTAIAAKQDVSNFDTSQLTVIRLPTHEYEYSATIPGVSLSSAYIKGSLFGSIITRITDPDYNSSADPLIMTKLNTQKLNWNLDKVKDISYMFSGCRYFNAEINFKTASATTTQGMFADCWRFNKPVKLDTSRVTVASQMFNECRVFNQPINFDMSSTEWMNYMFSGCREFNQPINFDGRNANNLDGMFSGCSDLDQAIRITTPKANSMSFMFYNCSQLNSVVQLNTSNVTNMSSMFGRCRSFNQDLSNWDTSKVTNRTDVMAGTPSWEAKNKLRFS